MKHLLLILAALGVAAVGVLILVESKCATTVAIAAGSFHVLLGVALAIPAQLMQAKTPLVALATAIKGAIGGKPPC